MDMSKETSLIVAAKDFFGLLPGTTIKEFSEEFKQLTDEDKAEFKTGLEANGYKIKA